MSILKARKLQIFLAILFLLSAGLSVYSVSHYRGDSTSVSTGVSQQGFRPGGGAVQHRDDVRRGPGRDTSSQSRQGDSSASPSDRGTNTFRGDFSAGNRGGNPMSGGNRFGGMANASSPYAAPLAWYAFLFFGFAAAAYFTIVRKKLHLHAGNNEPLTIGLLLGTGLFLRVAAAPWIPGHPFDINLFKRWAVAAASHLGRFYTGGGSSDYPPLYIYVLYAVGKLAAIPVMSPYFTLLIKLPSILADAATSFLLYKAARKHISFTASFLIAAFYLFNPAVLINSTFWGQVDSFFTLIVAAAVLLLSENKPGRSAALFTAAVLMKPQGIIFLPVLFFALVRMKQVKAWILATASAAAAALLLVIPFSIGQNPLWLFKLYSKTLNEYPYASVNAYNLFSLLGANYKPDTSILFLFSYHTWGMIFIAAVTLFSWRIYGKGGGGKFASAAALMQIAGVFTFSTGMHERYLFPAAALALLAYVHLQDKRLLWLSAGFSITIFLNTYWVLYHSAFGGAPYNGALFATSLLNVLLFGFLAKTVWDRFSSKELPMAEKELSEVQTAQAAK